MYFHFEINYGFNSSRYFLKDFFLKLFHPRIRNFTEEHKQQQAFQSPITNKGGFLPGDRNKGEKGKVVVDFVNCSERWLDGRTAE